MLVNSERFTVMLGHVEDGCEIIAPSGKRFKLKNTMRGWVIIDLRDNSEVSGNLKTAYEVEYFVVNGLQTH